MRSQKIKLVDQSAYGQYWLQYKESSSLPDYRIFFSDLISRIHHFALGRFYWNIGSLPESKIVGAGGQLKQLTGHSEEDWLGASPQFALAHFLPEDVPFVMSYVMKFDQYLQQLNISGRENAKASIYARVRTPEGAIKWFCIQYPGFYYNEEGRLIYVLSVCSDISHIKKDNNPPFMSILDTGQGEQQIFLCHDAEEELKPQSQLPKLSEREREIITLLARGRSSKQISSELFISKSAVDNHRQKLLRKLGASSTAEIIHLAVENGIV